MFVEAYNDVRLGILEQIEQSNFNQSREREDAYRMLRALASVRGKLENYIRKAQGAQHEPVSIQRVAEIGDK